MKQAVLILIDIQRAFSNPVWGKRNQPNAEENMWRLLQHWRKLAQPIIFIQHISNSPKSLFYHQSEGYLFQEGFEPLSNEVVFQKTVNSAFIGTALEQHLKSHHLNKLVIVGLTTNHCVETTTRMAGNLGFETYLVSDATATFGRQGIDGTYYSADLIHQISLTSLNQEFATVLNTDAILSL